MLASPATALTCATFALACATACAPPAQIRYEEHVERAPGAAKHAVHEERLAQLMRGLERLSRERLPKALDSGEQLRRHRQEIVDVARAMSESAARIPSVVADLELEPSEREEFVFLADVLQRRSITFAEEAPYLPMEGLRDRAAEIQETCNHCHGRFRIPRDRVGRAARIPGAAAADG